VTDSREPASGNPVATLLFQIGFWIPLLVCTYLALVPEPPEHPVFRLSDIVLHAGAFVYLTLALVLAQYGNTPIRTIRGALYVRTFVLMLAYGLFLELVQSFVPERTAEIKDLLVDLAGIAVGLGLARLIAGPVHELVTRLSAFLLKT
jgi:VanZ family protein